MQLSSARYHQLTSYQREKLPQHALDWENRPSVFKSYPDADLIPLPRNFQYKEADLYPLATSDNPEVTNSCNPGLLELSRIFGLTYSITAKTSYADGDFYYRSAASAGALYPAEIYVSVRDVEGLGDGIYHFSIADHGLFKVRDGNVCDATTHIFDKKLSKRTSLIFFVSVIFFRSAWKYRARSYRYLLLDTGHVLENLTLALKAEGFAHRVSYDFDDFAVNRLLGFDESKEVCLAVCPVEGLEPLKKTHGMEEILEASDSIKDASRVSKNEMVYPEVRQIHCAGFLKNPVPISAVSKPDRVIPMSGLSVPIVPPDNRPEKLNLRDSFLRRRSFRNFVPQRLSQNQLMALLGCITDSRPERREGVFGCLHALKTGVLVEEVDGIHPGFYWIDWATKRLQMVTEGRFCMDMAHSCLDQHWLSNAAVHFLFVADLEQADLIWGARAYRHFMIHSGRLGQRLYLEATAMNIGCCGIGAFYDSEAAQLLGLNGGERLLYLLALGPVKSIR